MAMHTGQSVDRTPRAKRAVNGMGIDNPEITDTVSPCPGTDDPEDNAIQDGSVSSVGKVGMAALGFGGNLASIQPGPIQRNNFPDLQILKNGEQPDPNFKTPQKAAVLDKLFGGKK